MEKPPSIDRSTLRLFWQASLLEKRLFLLALLYPLGAIFMNVMAPLFIGKTIAALANPQADPGTYLPYFIGSALIGLVANRFGFAFLLSYQAKVMQHLQSRAMSALLKRSVGFHNNNMAGKLVSDAIDYPNAFGMLTNALYINLIPFSLVLLIGSSVVLFESWILGLIVLAMASFSIMSGVIESNRRAPVRRRRQVVTKQVTGHIADAILNVQTIKTFAREKDELDHNNVLSGKLRDLRVKDWSTAARLGSNRLAVLFTLQFVLIWSVITLAKSNPDLLGVGIFAFSFTILMSSKLFEINGLLRNIEDGLLQASTMTEIILETPEIQDAKNARTLNVTKGGIELKDISFKYADSTSNETVFSNLTLSIKPGEKIGLVGPSGGGKSTLTRLLLRFDDLESGDITIDGQNIAEVTQHSLRSSISYVPQEPLLFHRTISENIAYGKPGATTSEIESAAKHAHAHDFIKKLPQGYDTIVGERGVKLSGGQRQRVAIARALLKNAPVLILDEATSALDSESELLIQDALWQLMQHRTALVIAHRLSTIQKMDRIVVLEAGRITEQGTHQQLLKKGGTYARLWKHQSGGFLEE